MEPICLPDISPSFNLEPGEPVFTMGSCFARNVEESLKAHGFIVPGLDFRVPPEELHSGTTSQPALLNKYTPFSMANEVEFAFADDDGSQFLVDLQDGTCLDEQLHTDRPVSIERALERRKQIRNFFHDGLTKCRVVVVTLGLSEAWWDDASKLYLNETPKRASLDRHPDRFYFEKLSPEKVIHAVDRLVNGLLNNGRQDKRILLTVSPVPFARSFSGQDAITANCYSKSVLRVAAEVCVSKHGAVDYYPSYESVTLTSRDLVWEDDFIHVKRDVVDANVKRMLSVYAPALQAGHVSDQAAE